MTIHTQPVSQQHLPPPPQQSLPSHQQQQQQQTQQPTVAVTMASIQSLNNNNNNSSNTNNTNTSSSSVSSSSIMPTNLTYTTNSSSAVTASLVASSSSTATITTSTLSTLSSVPQTIPVYNQSAMHANVYVPAGSGILGLNANHHHHQQQQQQQIYPAIVPASNSVYLNNVNLHGAWTVPNAGTAATYIPTATHYIHSGDMGGEQAPQTLLQAMPITLTSAQAQIHNGIGYGGRGSRRGGRTRGGGGMRRNDYNSNRYHQNTQPHHSNMHTHQAMQNNNNTTHHIILQPHQMPQSDVNQQLTSIPLPISLLQQQQPQSQSMHDHLHHGMHTTIHPQQQQLHHQPSQQHEAHLLTPGPVGQLLTTAPVGGTAAVNVSGVGPASAPTGPAQHYAPAPYPSYTFPTYFAPQNHMLHPATAAAQQSGATPFFVSSVPLYNTHPVATTPVYNYIPGYVYPQPTTAVMNPTGDYQYMPADDGGQLVADERLGHDPNAMLPQMWHSQPMYTDEYGIPEIPLTDVDMNHNAASDTPTSMLSPNYTLYDPQMQDMQQQMGTLQLYNDEPISQMHHDGIQPVDEDLSMPAAQQNQQQPPPPPTQLTVPSGTIIGTPIQLDLNSEHHLSHHGGSAHLLAPSVPTVHQRLMEEQLLTPPQQQQHISGQAGQAGDQSGGDKIMEPSSHISTPAEMDEYGAGDYSHNNEQCGVEQQQQIIQQQQQQEHQKQPELSDVVEPLMQTASSGTLKGSDESNSAGSQSQPEHQTSHYKQQRQQLQRALMMDSGSGAVLDNNNEQQQQQQQHQHDYKKQGQHRQNNTAPTNTNKKYQQPQQHYESRRGQNAHGYPQNSTRKKYLGNNEYHINNNQQQQQQQQQQQSMHNNNPNETWGANSVSSKKSTTSVAVTAIPDATSNHTSKSWTRITQPQQQQQQQHTQSQHHSQSRQYDKTLKSSFGPNAPAVIMPPTATERECELKTIQRAADVPTTASTVGKQSKVITTTTTTITTTTGVTMVTAETQTTDTSDTESLLAVSGAATSEVPIGDGQQQKQKLMKNSTAEGVDAAGTVTPQAGSSATTITTTTTPPANATAQLAYQEDCHIKAAGISTPVALSTPAPAVSVLQRPSTTTPPPPPPSAVNEGGAIKVGTAGSYPTPSSQAVKTTNTSTNSSSSGSGATTSGPTTQPIAPTPVSSWASLFTSKNTTNFTTTHGGNTASHNSHHDSNSSISNTSAVNSPALPIPKKSTGKVAAHYDNNSQPKAGFLSYSAASAQGHASSGNSKNSNKHEWSGGRAGGGGGAGGGEHGHHTGKTTELTHKFGDFLSKYKTDLTQNSLRPRGLTNRSNYCYINAILQALVGCSPFYNLVRAIPKHAANMSDIKTPTVNAMISFMNHFSNLPSGVRLRTHNKGGGGPKGKDDIGVDLQCDSAFEPTEIYKLWNESRDGHVEGRQEDAEEFLGYVLNRLNDEMLEVIKSVSKPNSIEQNGQNVESENENEMWQLICNNRNKGSVTRQTDFGRTPLSDIFRGELRSRLQREGEHSTDVIQPFFTLQLNIEKAASVKEALEILVGRNQIEGVTGIKSKQEVVAWQQMTLEKLPVILILHLKWFDYKSDVCSKILRKVEFPIELKIDTKILASKKYSQKQRAYRLCAVVYHDGRDTTNGHYISDVYHTGYNSWMRYDDNSVKPVSENHVLLPRTPRVPYLLYYRRCDTMTPQTTPASNNNSNNSSRNYHDHGGK